MSDDARPQPLRWVSRLLGFQELTFLKNRPKLRYPKEWEAPDQTAYQQELHWQGFISPNHMPEVVQYPIIAQDLRDLEEYLLPVFWDFNQKAKYYQNAFYLYQWIFIFGAFMTTVLAVLTTYYGAFGPAEAWFLFIGPVDGDLMVTIFSVLTALVSTVTSYYTLLSNYGEPRKRWASYRRLTEELRMQYFKFLSRIEPYHQADRVDQLRREVLNIRRQEQENG